jgi:hypothetical protein
VVAASVKWLSCSVTSIEVVLRLNSIYYVARGPIFNPSQRMFPYTASKIITKLLGLIGLDEFEPNRFGIFAS